MLGESIRNGRSFKGFGELGKVWECPEDLGRAKESWGELRETL